MGEDSHGKAFGSVNDLWKSVLGDRGEGIQEWYHQTLDYWSAQPASVNGVLAGFEIVSPIDLKASLTFLEKIKNLPPERGGSCSFQRALDCGAGVGRVTEGCLLQVFAHVDLLEPVPHLLDAARDKFRDCPQVENFFQVSLQDFTPTPHIYDCIWLQWCILYLTDDDLVKFLKRCSTALKEHGVLCVKENIAMNSRDGFHLDRGDNSLMRTDAHYRELFKAAGLKVILEMRQPKFPRVRDESASTIRNSGTQTLFPVMMYCLRATDS